jgi:hypothetical protein
LETSLRSLSKSGFDPGCTLMVGQPDREGGLFLAVKLPKVTFFQHSLLKNQIFHHFCFEAHSLFGPQNKNIFYFRKLRITYEQMYAQFVCMMPLSNHCLVQKVSE